MKYTKYIVLWALVILNLVMVVINFAELVSIANALAAVALLTTIWWLWWEEL